MRGWFRAHPPRALRVFCSTQEWVNIKHVFKAAKPTIRGAGMAGMLAAMNMELVGRHHSGRPKRRC